MSMKERPILFSAPMVRAILAGTKTQTRRVVKPRKDRDMGCTLAPHEIAGEVNAGRYRNCPYGQPGDRLWVREGFKPVASGAVKDGYGEVRYGFAYKADNATIWAERPTTIHDLTGQPPTGPMQFKERAWKPSIHMPKRASRIMLDVTGVRVERLHALSDADALAEGIDTESEVYDEGESLQAAGSPASPERYTFATLWRSINGDSSWEANPWVWVVEFRRSAA